MKVTREQLFEFDFEVAQLRLILVELFKERPWLVSRYEKQMDALLNELLEDDR